MKKIVFIISHSLICCSCNQEKTAQPTTTKLAVIIDVTDPQALLPLAIPILGLFRFSDDKNRAASYRITSVTDRLLNQAGEFELADGYSTEKENTDSDPYLREKLILDFYDRFKKEIARFDTLNSIHSSLHHSECFYTISKELSLLSKNTTGKNILLVFSDLQENSDLFNCYEKKNSNMIESSPKKIKELFEKSHLLPSDLTNTIIFFVFAPRDRQEDKKYMAMVTLYKLLLEPRGAKITVQADNTNYAYGQ